MRLFAFLYLAWLARLSESSFFAQKPAFVAINFEKPDDVIRRLPIAVIESVQTASISYLGAACFTFPGGLIWKIGQIRALGWKAWFKEGCKIGNEWACFSGLYQVTKC